MSWLLRVTDSNSPNWWSGPYFPPLLKTDQRAQWDLEGGPPAQASSKNCSQLVQTLTSPCPPPAHTYSQWLSQECLSYIFPPASSHSLILKAVRRYHLHIYEKKHEGWWPCSVPPTRDDPVDLQWNCNTASAPAPADLRPWSTAHWACSHPQTGFCPSCD